MRGLFFGFPVSVVLWCCSAWFFQYRFYWPLLLICLALFLPFGILWNHLFAFPWDYSALGRYERTPRPATKPLAKFFSLGAVRAWALFWQMFFMRLYVFPHGVGFRVGLLSEAFIPFERVDRVRQSGFPWRNGFILYHHCPEIRSPIKFYSTSAYYRITFLLQERSIPVL